MVNNYNLSIYKMTRGRPPTYCELIDGQMYVTPETLDKEIERLEKHRTDCRNRYRRKRDMLKTLRPDLFDNRNGCRTNQQIVRRFGIPLGSIIPQSPEEERSSSQTEGRRGFREVSLGEAINFTAT